MEDEVMTSAMLAAIREVRSLRSIGDLTPTPQDIADVSKAVSERHGSGLLLDIHARFQLGGCPSTAMHLLIMALITGRCPDASILVRLAQRAGIAQEQRSNSMSNEVKIVIEVKGLEELVAEVRRLADRAANPLTVTASLTAAPEQPAEAVAPAETAVKRGRKPKSEAAPAPVPAQATEAAIAAKAEKDEFDEEESSAPIVPAAPAVEAAPPPPSYTLEQLRAAAVEGSKRIERELNDPVKYEEVRKKYSALLWDKTGQARANGPDGKPVKRGFEGARPECYGAAIEWSKSVKAKDLV